MVLGIMSRLPGQQRKSTLNGVEVNERSDGGFEMSLRPPSSRAVHFCRPRGAQLPFAAVLPGDGVVEAVLTTGINQFLSLYNAALIGRIILTWFPNPPAAIVGPLATVTDPYLNLFRGIIPPLGGTIDLSPILAFVVLDLFTNAAAALPAELDESGQLKRPAGSSRNPVSTVAQAWQRRQEASAARRAAQQQQQQ